MLPKAFLVLISMVVLVSIVFGFIIWRQTISFEKKASIYKQKKDEYLKNLEEEARKARAMRNSDPEGNPESN
ncbi:MAG: hypothetical protein ABFD08_14350 [Syntrophomonas sp.]